MRWKWIITIGVLMIVILIAAVYGYLYTYDYNKLKPWIARMVEDATGRKLSLGGEVNLEIGFSPALVVTNVPLANVSWGSQPQMIEIERLHAQVRLLPLLFKDVEVKHIGLVGVDVLLETDSNEQGNWDFTSGEKSGKSFGVFEPIKIDIDSIRIENLSLAFRLGKPGSAERFTLARLDLAKHGAFDTLKLDLLVDYKGQPVALSGTSGMIHLLFAHQRFPLKMSGKYSNVAAKIDGAIEDVLNLYGIDLKTQASGTNLEDLRRGLGIKLPKTTAFEVTGHLTGSRESLTFKDVSGNLSASGVDIAISGIIGDLIAISSVDLKLTASGKDLAEIGSIIGEKLPKTDDFTVQGRLTGSAKVLSLSEVQGSAHRGSMLIAVNGAVKDLLTIRGMDLQSWLTGKDLAEFGEIIGEKLPATDQFEIQGRLIGSTDALALQEAQGSASRGSMKLTVTGGISQLLALEGINVKLNASGKQLGEIGPLAGTDLPELGPFDVSGKLSGSAKAISLNEFSAMIDKIDFNGLAKV